MDIGAIIILGIVGYLIYKGLQSNDSPNTTNTPYRQRRTGQGANYNTESNSNKNSLIQSAKRQENMGNFDEASRLYLRAGQVFSAAKMKALKGPQAAKSAVEIIQVNSPERAELITRNLANEFYYRLEQPATAAALLRGLGLDEEAEAVEVAAGLSPASQIAEPAPSESEITEPQSSAKSESPPELEPDDESYDPDEMAKELDELVGDDDTPTDPKELEELFGEEQTKAAPPEAEVPEDEIPREFPNTLMMASNSMPDKCSVCKREIKSGDSFIYCLNCGKPGHYAHLGEMIKVTGQCPVCKGRLTPTMYEI